MPWCRAVTDALHAIVELDGAPFGPLAFGPPRRVIEARTLAEVHPGPAGASSAAARAGRWAVGYVAYEAAPAFDAALRVRRPGPDRSAGSASTTPRSDRRRRARATRGSADSAPELEPPTTPAAVERIREAIAAGAVYQVNFTLRLRGRLEGDPLALYRRLRAAQGGGRDGLPAGRRPGGRLGLARALPAPARRPGGDPPHEGDGPARALARGGRGGGAGCWPRRRRTAPRT